jgi:Putative lumazine-binding
MSTSTATAMQTYLSEYDAIVKVMNLYNEGVRTGNSAVMKPGFHSACTFFGYVENKLLAGPIQMLFDWVDGNGPSSELRVRFASIDILDTIAAVRIEMENLTGKLAGTAGARLSDLFQLIKVDGNWQISQKSFHWHSA